MDEIINFFFRIAIKLLQLLNSKILTYFFFRLFITIEKNKYEYDYTILILDIERFRGDIELFAKAEKIRVLKISWTFLAYLLRCFVNLSLLNKTKNLHGKRGEFLSSKKGTKTYEQRGDYRNFLRIYLPFILKKLNVQLVINSELRYKREADILKVLTEIKVPYICFYREALFIAKAQYKSAVMRHKEYGNFCGDFIAVQNEITKKMFVESGIVNPNKIIVRGCPRMDNYIQEIKKNKKIIKRKNKVISFFTSPIEIHHSERNKPGIKLFKYTSKILIEVIKFIDKHENFRLIIKVKDSHMKSQIQKIEKLIFDHSTNSGAKRISINSEKMSAQQVIFNSDLIFAAQSTVVIEAAITRKPVIISLPYDILSNKYLKDMIMFYPELNLFSSPIKINKIQSIIMNKIDDFKPNISYHKKINNMFSKYVSNLNMNSTKYCTDLIKGIIDG